MSDILLPITKGIVSSAMGHVIPGVLEPFDITDSVPLHVVPSNQLTVDHSTGQTFEKSSGQVVQGDSMSAALGFKDSFEHPAYVTTNGHIGTLDHHIVNGEYYELGYGAGYAAISGAVEQTVEYKIEGWVDEYNWSKTAGAKDAEEKLYEDRRNLSSSTPKSQPLEREKDKVHNDHMQSVEDENELAVALKEVEWMVDYLQAADTEDDAEGQERKAMALSAAEAMDVEDVVDSELVTNLLKAILYFEDKFESAQDSAELQATADESVQALEVEKESKGREAEKELAVAIEEAEWMIKFLTNISTDDEVGQELKAMALSAAEAMTLEELAGSDLATTLLTAVMYFEELERASCAGKQD